MVYYISGFRETNAKKVCQFFFGDFYVSCTLIERDRYFKIEVYKTLKVRQKDGLVKEERIEDYIDIDSFKKFWGPQWKIVYINEQEA